MTLPKARPRDVVRPKPPTQVLLFEADTDDDDLRREHRRRGWPERFSVKGVEHDYVVVDSSGTPVEAVEHATRAAQAVKQRARRDSCPPARAARTDQPAHSPSGLAARG